jgi:hypothetical protein
MKRVLKVDPDADEDHFLIRGQLTMVWESCRTCAAVESQERAQRAASQLPPQISVGDFETSRRAYETQLGFKLPDHLVPSQPLFELVLAQAESTFEAIRLTLVTSLAQQKVMAPASSNSGLVGWDEKAKTFRKETKTFEVPMPVTAEGLEAKMEVLGHAYAMVKMRFGSNPKLATVSTDHIDRYVKWLKGPQVWNFVIKGREGQPKSCPHIGHITDYDFALRDKQAELMNTGHDFKRSLEIAMADSDLRMQRFMGPFTVEVNSQDCLALTAPGISDVFPQLQARGVKRGHFVSLEEEQRDAARIATTSTGTLSKGQLKKAKKKLASKREQEMRAGQSQRDKAAAAAAAAAAGGGRAKGGKGRGKGNAIGKGPGGPAAPQQLPPGCRDRDDQGRQICFAFNKGNCTRGAACKFAHVSWKIDGAGPPGGGVGSLPA